jgi:hypothetical protein
MGILSQLLGLPQQQAPAPTAAAPVAPFQPPAPVAQQGLISGLLGLSPEMTQQIHGVAAGLANVDPASTGLLSIAQAAQGSGKYYDDLKQQQQQAQMEHDKLIYQQQQDAMDNSRADKRLSLDERNMNHDNALADVANKREEIAFEYKKKEIQSSLDDLAKNNGIPLAQRQNAQKLADDVATRAATQETVDPVTFQSVKKFDIDVYNRVLQEQYQKFINPQAVADPTLSTPAAVTATNRKTGEKLIYQNGKWVPANQ